MSDIIETNSLTMPRPINFLSRFWTRYRETRVRRQRQRLNRSAFENLLYKEDRILRDIGVSRADVEWAAGLPLNRNAARELEQIKILRRQGFCH